MNSDLYHIRQQFTLGAYKAVAQAPLPPASSPEYNATLLYKARSCIALLEPEKVGTLVPVDTENVALRAVTALANYVQASKTEDYASQEKALELLRDLCIEIEDDFVGSEEDGELVRVLAGTAFKLAGEIEEALESLGAGTAQENLEAVAVTVQIYLSISRTDLALKEFNRSKQWAEDDLLLGQIESSISLVTGTNNYANSFSFYTEQLGNPTLQNAKLLTSRGVARLLRGEIAEGKSDLEESINQGGEDAETRAALVTAAALSGSAKREEAEQIWRSFAQAYPNHPLAIDLLEKDASFDEALSEIVLPPLAEVGA